MVPLVSVILPVYNQEKYLAETIESVLEQSFRDFEFLILDDGSTDASASIIQKYAAQDKRILAYYQQNRGKCLATNYLVSNARGVYCAFIDADDLMLPERLKKQVAFHLANPTVGASSCHCLYISETGRILGKQYYPGLESAAACERSRHNKHVVQCSFTGLMTSKKSFLEVGGLRPHIWPGEDFDFFNLYIDKGHTLVIIQDVLMKYRLHSSSVTEKNPMDVFDKIGWIYHCIALRRENKAEISFEEFLQLRQDDPWWVKFNRRKFNYSQIYFRRAGLALMSKNYIRFFWQITVSTLLSPSHALMKLVRLSKKQGASRASSPS